MIGKPGEKMNDHVSLSVQKLKVGSRLPFDVFILEDGCMKPLFNKGMVFSRIAQSVLQEKGVSEILVPVQEAADVDAYMSPVPQQNGAPPDSAEAFASYSHQKSQFFQVDRGLLVQGSVIPFSIYSLQQFAFSAIAEASESKPTIVGPTILGSSGQLVILNTDVHLYHEYLNQLSEGKGPPGGEAPRVKALVLKENSKIIMKELLDDPRSGQAIKKTGELIHTMIDSILENRDTIYDLLSLRQYDYYTYTHSVNVSVLAVGLGVAISLGKDATAKLGMGAMLHDVGKSAIPSEVLNKQGKLNDAEYSLIQTHVQEGEKILRGNPEVPEEAFPAVLQHHEKMSGRGYPFRLKGPQIKLFGKIAAIADCYDALTTKRPYKEPMTPFYALSIIAKETGDYDPELLKIFIKMLGKIK